MKGKDKVLW